MDTARHPGDSDRQRAFRDAMGLFPTGVTLVTARSADGVDQAITANSFTSVSLDPLLVLVCVEHASRLHDVALAAGRWGVSVLSLDGEPLSRKLARRGHDTAGALAGVAHHRGPHTGALLLDGALATFECVTVAAHPGGDHTVLLGEVLAVDMPHPEEPPLAYRSRRRH
jgi:flavin reductase (DIM6/NTAB) family NADH-FMN oxidoreductase RutF